MTVVGADTGQNPYGDQSGMAPDWAAQQGQVQTAYDTALQKLQFQREGILQQYGFTSSGGLNDILGGKGANIEFNPQFQNSVYGNAMKQHGNTLQGLRAKTAMRGIGDYGLGAQDENSYQQQASAENEGIKSNLLQSLTGNVTDAQDALNAKNQGITDITGQQGLYNQWAGSHYQSEGGNKPDPFDTDIIGNDITKGLGGINFKDSISAGASLGRVRDNLKHYLEYAGDEGYNPAQLKKFNADYRAALKKAGLNPYDKKWGLGEDSLDRNPAQEQLDKNEADRQARVKKAQDHLRQDKLNARRMKAYRHKHLRGGGGHNQGGLAGGG